MNANIFLTFWFFPLFAMQLAMSEMLVVKPPVKLVVIQGGRASK